MVFYLTRFVAGVPTVEEQCRRQYGEAYHLYQRTTSTMLPLPLLHSHISDHKLFNSHHGLANVAYDGEGHTHTHTHTHTQYTTTTLLTTNTTTTTTTHA